MYGWEFNTAALPGHYCTECGHKRSASPSGIYTSLFLYYERKWTRLFFCHKFKCKQVIEFRFLFFTHPIMILLFYNFSICQRCCYFSASPTVICCNTVTTYDKLFYLLLFLLLSSDVPVLNWGLAWCVRCLSKLSRTGP